MNDAVESPLTEARAAWEARMKAVAQNDWELPTPCTEWNVRQLVNHVVGQEFRMALLLRGGGLDEFIAIRDDDFLGNDVIAAWVEGCQHLNAAISEPAAMDRLVEYRTGPITGRLLIAVRVFDMIVHTWDLARGIGVDEDLGDSLVLWASQQLDGPLRFLSQAFPAVELPAAGISEQERLLGFCGRRPG